MPLTARERFSHGAAAVFRTSGSRRAVARLADARQATSMRAVAAPKRFSM